MLHHELEDLYYHAPFMLNHAFTWDYPLDSTQWIEIVASIPIDTGMNWRLSHNFQENNDNSFFHTMSCQITWSIMNIVAPFYGLLHNDGSTQIWYHA